MSLPSALSPFHSVLLPPPSLPPSRNAGFVVVVLSGLSPAMLVLYTGLM